LHRFQVLIQIQSVTDRQIDGRPEAMAKTREAFCYRAQKLWRKDSNHSVIRCYCHNDAYGVPLQVSQKWGNVISPLKKWGTWGTAFSCVPLNLSTARSNGNVPAMTTHQTRFYIIVQNVNACKPARVIRE